MKCPNCGEESKRKKCQYCGYELPFSENMVSIKMFLIDFSYIINTILLPPAKIGFLFWSFCCICEFTDNTSLLYEKVLTAVVGYFLMCGVTNLIYMAKPRRHLAYKQKTIEKKKNRIQALLDKYYPYKSLLDEANSLENIVNTTTNNIEFQRSYDRLIEIFTKLKKYEYLGVFTNSPTEDLNDLIHSREAATKKFYERSHKKESLHSNTPADLQATFPRNIPCATVAQIEHDPVIFRVPESVDPYFIDAVKLVVLKGNAAIGMLQRHFNIGFNRAASIMDQLEAAGIVAAENGTAPRRVLMTLKQFEQYSNYEQFEFPYHDLDECSVLSDTNKRITLYNNQYDYMNGHDFEYFCADLLRKNGFSNVEVTQGSGDHGIDILADKDDIDHISYAIQCKCYSSNIGNAAVQQAHTGKSLYHKDIAVVLTNQYFTAQAKEEADALGVKLWDRDKLQELVNNSQ